MRGSHSTQGLATVGLGNFKIGALHDMIQADLPHEEDDGGFFPGGLGVPDSFKGEVTTPFLVCCGLIVKVGGAMGSLLVGPLVGA